jgi:acetyl-CoA synthetase
MPEPKVYYSDVINSYVSSFEMYKELYHESIECPEDFWMKIAKQFYWEKGAEDGKFLTYNFDIRKGPIFIKYLNGAKTNICYNILDRNIKNGYGDRIAFYW